MKMLSKLKFLANVRREIRGGIKFVRIDASSKCQLKCPLCSTSQGTNRDGIIGWGVLNPYDFERFIESNPSINTVELSNWGEIFLNPGIDDIIKIAYRNEITLISKNGSNLNTVDKRTLESLVKYKFRYLSVSLDGATQETYEIYRKTGKFDKVIENIKLINHYKQIYNSVYPKLRWQFILFGHNEHEIKAAQKMADNLNMEFYLKLNYDSDYSPVKNGAFIRQTYGINYISREEYKTRRKKEYAIPCKQFWLSPQINWDGKLLGCCANIYSDFGNVFESSLDHCLESEKYTYTKNMLLGKVPSMDDIPCTHCSIFKSSKKAVASMF